MRSCAQRPRRSPESRPAAAPEQPAAAEPVDSAGHCRSPARYLWAMLIARIYEVFPLVCPTHCGAEMRIANRLDHRDRLGDPQSALRHPAWVRLF
jgi:hypothetical protein